MKQIESLSKQNISNNSQKSQYIESFVIILLWFLYKKKQIILQVCEGADLRSKYSKYHITNEISNKELIL